MSVTADLWNWPSLPLTPTPYTSIKPINNHTTSMADEQSIQVEPIPQKLSHLIELNERYGVLLFWIRNVVAQCGRHDIRFEAEDILAAEDQIPEDGRYEGRRYAVYSVWRPLKPVARDPLAMCDPSSILRMAWSGLVSTGRIFRTHTTSVENNPNDKNGIGSRINNLTRY